MNNQFWSYKFFSENWLKRKKVENYKLKNIYKEKLKPYIKMDKKNPGVWLYKNPISINDIHINKIVFLLTNKILNVS